MMLVVQLECCGVERPDDWRTSWWMNHTANASQVHIAVSASVNHRLEIHTSLDYNEQISQILRVMALFIVICGSRAYYISSILYSDICSLNRSMTVSGSPQTLYLQLLSRAYTVIR